ncbi:MAG: NAD(P)/FAD-dependent oxidoreductase [Alphaproteobacteria bacterium]
MSNFEIDGYRDSLWQKTAVKRPETNVLDKDGTCDVVIIGAGFTGLNAAIDLANAGLSVVVLEGAELGFGASGRAGGQVNMGMNMSPNELKVHYGEHQAERSIHMMRETPTRVFDRIRKLGLDCDPVQNGWLQAAVDKTYLHKQSDLAKQYAAYGGGMELVEKDEFASLSGSAAYVGGIFCPTAGSLHPLSYTLELARTAIQLGVKIFSNSPAIDLAKVAGSWQVTTKNGAEVTAGQVLNCTNGYTGPLIPGLFQKIVPVRSVLAATEPLSKELREQVLPNQVSFVDKRRLVLYMRYDRHGRLCSGDHGPARDNFTLSDFDAAKQRTIDVFPALKEVKWDYHWGGRIAMTRDHLPFIANPDDGLWVGMGYNGRGVGMGSIVGMNLAKAAIAKHKGLAAPELDLPISSPKSYPFHRFHNLGVRIGIAWAEYLDKLQAKRAQRT